MLTIDDALTYLGIDYPDDVVRTNVTRALATARATVLGGVGEDVETYLPDDSRVAELTLIYMEDLYSQRGASAKVTNATRKLVLSMESQLRLELARAKEEAGVE